MSYKVNGRLVINAPSGFVGAFKGGKHKGKAYAYRIVAAQMLGRDLLATEVVHHIDGDKSNNEPENLMVFATGSDHTTFHKHNCDLDIVIKTETGAYIIDKAKIQHRCPHCGKEMPYAPDGVCITCYKAARREKAENRLIQVFPNIADNNGLLDKQLLQDLVSRLPATKIATRCGISVQAIRKLCNRFGVHLQPSGYWAKVYAGK